LSSASTNVEWCILNPFLRDRGKRVPRRSWSVKASRTWTPTVVPQYCKGRFELVKHDFIGRMEAMQRDLVHALSASELPTRSFAGDFTVFQYPANNVFQYPARYPGLRVRSGGVSFCWKEFYYGISCND
jgi:hypothetical protein